MHKKENNGELAKRCFKQARKMDRLAAAYGALHADQWIKKNPVRAVLYLSALCLAGVAVGVVFDA